MKGQGMSNRGASEASFDEIEGRVPLLPDFFDAELYRQDNIYSYSCVCCRSVVGVVVYISLTEAKAHQVYCQDCFELMYSPDANLTTKGVPCFYCLHRYTDLSQLQLMPEMVTEGQYFVCLSCLRDLRKNLTRQKLENVIVKGIFELPQMELRDD